MTIEAMPGADELPGYINMNWASSLLVPLKERWYIERDTVNMRPDDVRTIIDECMDCGLKMDLSSASAGRNRFYYFSSGTCLCHNCVHKYASCSMKVARWRDPVSLVERNVPVVSWLHMGQGWTTLEAVSDNGQLGTMWLTGGEEVRIIVRVFKWHPDVHGWVDDHDNARLPAQYENMLWAWIEDELKRMTEQSLGAAKGHSVSESIQRIRRLRALRPAGHL